MRLTQILCPNCKTSLTSKAGIEEGTSIACPKCKQKFDALAPDEEAAEDFEVVDDDEDAAPAKKRASLRRDREDEQEEETGNKKKARPAARSDDDEDEPPQSKKRSRDDDDSDDRPLRKKKRKIRDEDDEELGTFGELKKNVWVRVSVLGVLLAILGVLGYLLYVKNSKKDDPAPVSKTDNDDDLGKPIIVPKKAETHTTSDQDKFQGSWTAIAATWDGDAYNAQGLQDLRFTIKADRWTYQNQTNVKFGSRCKLDPAKKPAEIDLIHNDNQTSLGIYKFVDKDTVEICSRKDPGERPKEFAAPKGSKFLYMKLKRDSKSSPPPKSKDDTPVANDANQLSGSWTATAFQIKGAKDSESGALASMVKLAGQPNGLERIRLTITQDEWILEDNEEIDHYKIDAGKNPAEIDLVHSDGSSSHGIWRLTKQNRISTLEVIFSMKGDRPKNFDEAPPDGFVNFKFSRGPQ
jgi:uncharacterized protein (TIGR03067 family)